MEQSLEVPDFSIPVVPANAGTLQDVGTFKVVFNKKKFDISFDLDSTISQLKEHLHSIIGSYTRLNILSCVDIR